MEIVVAHNFYKQHGGEDQCVAAEVAMLKAHGHNVREYYLHNDAVDDMNRLKLASRTIWSGPAFRDLRDIFQAHRSQIVHFHNTFPLISPAAYYAAKAENVRVVQTVHNFRLSCVNALLFRAGAVCEDCLGKSIVWPGVAHKCYHDSYLASAAIGAMLTAHRAFGTWRNAVDIYIALTEFSRRKIIEGGLPADRVVVKPNFVTPDPGPGEGRAGYCVFVGRLSAEKGVDTLIEAWRHLGGTVPLKIVGNGPLDHLAREATKRDPAIEWLGSASIDTVYELVGEAAALILPSRWYENFPRVIAEAFAKGTPVIAPRLGAMTEIVDDGCTGLHFEPGDPVDLAEKVRSALSDSVRLKQMRRAARQRFVNDLNADSNYNMLMAIYERALHGEGARQMLHATV